MKHVNNKHWIIQMIYLVLPCGIQDPVEDGGDVIVALEGVEDVGGEGGDQGAPHAPTLLPLVIPGAGVPHVNTLLCDVSKRSEYTGLNA